MVGVSGDASKTFRCQQEVKERDRVGKSRTESLVRHAGSSRECADEVSMGAGDDVSLRKWLDRPARKVDHLECLHIFRQIVEIVNLSHSQGIVVHNVRPSCFLLSSHSCHVSFSESSCSSSGSDSHKDAEQVTAGRCSSPSLYELHKQRSKLDHEGSSVEISTVDAYKKASGSNCSWLGSPYATHGLSFEEMKDVNIEDAKKLEEVVESRKNIARKQILLAEISWYTSPEEVAGGPSSFSSDVYRLGVLLFELFCTFSSTEAKLRTMTNLRHRVLPPQLLLKCSKEASFCLWLIHPQPSTRPKMIELLQSEFLNEARVDLDKYESAMKHREDIEEQELLIEFLLEVQRRKQYDSDKLHDAVCCLSSDIEEVMNQQSALNTGYLYPQLKNDGSLSLGNVDHSLLNQLKNEDSTRLGSRKRSRPRVLIHEEEEFIENLGNFQVSRALDNPRVFRSKSSRLLKNFAKLESAYFAARCRPSRPMNDLTNRSSQVGSNGKGSTVVTQGSSVHKLGSKDGNSEARKSVWVNPFLEGLCKYLTFSELQVRADLKQGDPLKSSNLVCALSFDRDKELFASAGVNRKIKVFEYDVILREDRDIHYPLIEMATKSKLSSICWNGYIKSQIASCDFEGAVQVWDVSRGQVFMNMREHERRVWSVDYSLVDPTKLVSGSDDGAVKLWSINQGGSVGTIKTKANVCSVQFPPDSALSVAVGSADHNIYWYDLRTTRVPLCTLTGHTKTVSYVKYVDSTTLVSASTDNSLKLWDLSTCASRATESPLQTFTGHTNLKNFVGLSVYDGYIATGSETNEVFIYHRAFPMPVLSFKFNCPDPLSGREVDVSEQFVSSVCWRGQSSTLLAANSTGNLKILEMV